MLVDIPIQFAENSFTLVEEVLRRLVALSFVKLVWYFVFNNNFAVVELELLSDQGLWTVSQKIGSGSWKSWDCPNLQFISPEITSLLDCLLTGIPVFEKSTASECKLAISRQLGCRVPSSA